MHAIPSGAVWRRIAGRDWLSKNRDALDAATGGTCAVVERPNHPRVSIECFCAGTTEAKLLQARFGGAIERVPADWLERCAREHLHPPIRVGQRLVVVADPVQKDSAASANVLVIPAGAAFGTGDHPTTAMSLRLLEESSRALRQNWRAFDAGTGSGILALAARAFGAAGVLAIDNDPRAVRTAKANATLNKIAGIRFRIGDALKRISAEKFDIITANLFSELLIEALPRWRSRLRVSGCVILSGILREQERDVVSALRRHAFAISIVRRRGKWIAILATIRCP